MATIGSEQSEELHKAGDEKTIESTKETAAVKAEAGDEKTVESTKETPTVKSAAGEAVPADNGSHKLEEESDPAAAAPAPQEDSDVPDTDSKVDKEAEKKAAGAAEVKKAVDEHLEATKSQPVSKKTEEVEIPITEEHLKDGPKAVEATKGPEVEKAKPAEAEKQQTSSTVKDLSSPVADPAEALPNIQEPDSAAPQSDTKPTSSVKEEAPSLPATAAPKEPEKAIKVAETSAPVVAPIESIKETHSSEAVNPTNPVPVAGTSAPVEPPIESIKETHSSEAVSPTKPVSTAKEDVPSATQVPAKAALEEPKEVNVAETPAPATIEKAKEPVSDKKNAPEEPEKESKVTVSPAPAPAPAEKVKESVTSKNEGQASTKEDAPSAPSVSAKTTPEEVKEVKIAETPVPATNEEAKEPEGTQKDVPQEPKKESKVSESPAPVPTPSETPKEASTPKGKETGSAKETTTSSSVAVENLDSKTTTKAVTSAPTDPEHAQTVITQTTETKDTLVTATATVKTVEPKKDREDDSVIEKAEHYIEIVGNEVYKGAGEVVETVKQHPELIAEGVVAVAIGAASLIQPELIAGEIAVIGKMASDAATKSVTQIGQDEAKKIAASISKDVSEDKDLDGVKDVDEEKAKEHAPAPKADPSPVPAETPKTVAKEVKDAPKGDKPSEEKPKEGKLTEEEKSKNGEPKEETHKKDGEHSIALDVAQEGKDTDGDGKPDAPAEPVSLKITIGADGAVKSVTQEKKAPVEEAPKIEAKEEEVPNTAETTKALIDNAEATQSQEPISAEALIPKNPTPTPTANDKVVDQPTSSSVATPHQTIEELKKEQPAAPSEESKVPESESKLPEIVAPLAAAALVTSAVAGSSKPTEVKGVAQPKGAASAPKEVEQHESEPELVTIPKQSLDQLHSKMDAMAAAIEQLNHTLATHPALAPPAPDTSKATVSETDTPVEPSVITETIPASEIPVPTGDAPSTPIPGSTDEPSKKTDAGEPTTASAEASTTTTPAADPSVKPTTPVKKPGHKKKGSVFGFLWPFGGAAPPALTTGSANAEGAPSSMAENTSASTSAPNTKADGGEEQNELAVGVPALAA